MRDADSPEEDGLETDRFSLEIEPRKPPIFLGVVFRNKAGEVLRASENGHYILSKEVGKAIKNLIVESAGAAGEYVPETFIFEAGEVFYNEGAIRDVRLEGRFIGSTDVDGVIEYERWVTARPPALKIGDDGSLELGAEDQGRTHIAALAGPSYTHISWNTKALFQRGLDSEETDLFVLNLFVDEDQPREKEEEVRREPFPFDIQEIAETSALIKDVPAEDLSKLLIPTETISAGRMVTISKSDAERDLVYSYSEEKMRSDLALAYAQSIRITTELIEGLSKRMRVSMEQAKAILFLRHQQAQKAFVAENIEQTHEWSRKIIDDMFSRSLLIEVVTKALAKWKHPWVTKESPFQKLENKLIEEAKKTIKARLEMRRAGRPERTENKEASLEEMERRIEEQEETIKKYIGIVYTQSIEQDLNIRDNEDSVNFKSVLAEMKKDIKKMSRTTLYRWLAECGAKFEDLKDEVLRELSQKY